MEMKRAIATIAAKKESAGIASCAIVVVVGLFVHIRPAGAGSPASSVLVSTLPRCLLFDWRVLGFGLLLEELGRHAGSFWRISTRRRRER